MKPLQFPPIVAFLFVVPNTAQADWPMFGGDPEHDEGVGPFWCIDLEKAVTFGKVNKDHDVSAKNNHFDPTAPIN